MVLDFIKIILLILLVIVVLVDIPKNKILIDPYYQFVFACIILLILLAIDTSIGFILAIILLIIYYKLYTKLLKENTTNDSKNINNNDINKNINNNQISKLDYMSDTHLLAAQTNIFDTTSYNTEVKGFKQGYNNEHVISAQGLDLDKANVPGYDNNYYLSYNLNDYFNKNI